jgi:beta-galactosidase
MRTSTHPDFWMVLFRRVLQYTGRLAIKLTTLEGVPYLRVLESPIDPRTSRWLIWLCLVSFTGLWLCATGPTGVAQTTRERTSFNADWRFRQNDPPGTEGLLAYATIKDWITSTGNQFVINTPARPRPEGNLGEAIAYTQRGFDDANWRKLNLPHDWGIESKFQQEYPGQTGKLHWWGVGWYRKSFSILPAERDKRFYLEIDGAMAYSAVWLNGRFVGGWPYGYASYSLDLTPYIDYGKENCIAIRLDNPPESSRWYPGGGIYRNVWLVKTSQVHVGHWGTYITTPEVSSDGATVDLRVAVQNDSRSDTDVRLRTSIHELLPGGVRRGASVATSTSPRIVLSVGRTQESLSRLRVPRPRLWSVNQPNLYVATVEIVRRGRSIDRYETVFGIRTIKFDADRGLLLNGKHVRLNGVCNHHDLGPLGTAINLRALERQIELLKEMGCNAIRTSHNPPAPELLDLCDRMGMLVIDEAFDVWRRAKKRNDYHVLFDDWHEKDLRALVRRDRNHPSVILWSTGNEIGEQGTPEGHKLSEALTKIVCDEDATRPVTAGCDHIPAGHNGFQKTVDVFGYNYKPGEYVRFHKSNPSIPLLSAESASCISSRGEYFFPVENDKSKGMADFHMSSYDLYAPRWATTPDAEFKGQDESPFVAGEFVWTGFDYLGEPTPYGGDSETALIFTNTAEQELKSAELKQKGKIRVPSRSSYFGIMDLAGFKKDRFFIYQARWRPELPMAHILPHWSWPDRVGQVTPVHVYTSGDEAELFLNGRSLGRKKKGLYEYRLRWDDVKYEPGELKVIAYRKGVRWTETSTRTAGPAAKLTIKADRSLIRADGGDLSFITVAVSDKDGLPVPRSKDRIWFNVSGPGEIVAVDNGDPTNHESFQSKERNAFNALCLVIVRSIAGRPGPIRLRARSDGIQGGEVVVTSR